MIAGYQEINFILFILILSGCLIAAAYKLDDLYINYIEEKQDRKNKDIEFIKKVENFKL